MTNRIETKAASNVQARREPWETPHVVSAAISSTEKLAFSDEFIDIGPAS